MDRIPSHTLEKKRQAHLEAQVKKQKKQSILDRPVRELFIIWLETNKKIVHELLTPGRFKSRDTLDILTRKIKNIDYYVVVIGINLIIASAVLYLTLY
tara:strand:- start:2444 stop:2737 length:294 start_codon:yes stop_codon:yes gene_type:complete